jgi:SAM-dependent methyltransferase
MRAVPVRTGQIDVVLSMFTSLGYFATPEDDRHVIAEIARILSPGGRFVADLMNPPVVERTLVARNERRAGEYRVEEARAIEEGTVVKRIVIRSENGEIVRRYRERVRLIDRGTLAAWCAHQGLRLRRSFGDYDGGEFSPEESPRLIALFVKDAS